MLLALPSGYIVPFVLVYLQLRLCGDKLSELIWWVDGWLDDYLVMLFIVKRYLGKYNRPEVQTLHLGRWEVDAHTVFDFQIFQSSVTVDRSTKAALRTPVMKEPCLFILCRCRVTRRQRCNRYETYYGPGMECAQQLYQLAIVHMLSWPAGMLWLAVTAVACTPFQVYAN